MPALGSRPPTIPPPIPQSPPQPASSAPSLPATPAPPPKVMTEELALADGTGTVPPEQLPAGRRGVLVGALAGVAIVAVIGVIVAFAMNGGSKSPKPTQVASAAGSDVSTVTVQPIEVPDAAVAVAVTPPAAAIVAEPEPAAEPQPEPEPVVAPPAQPSPSSKKHVHPAKQHVASTAKAHAETKAPTPPHAALTREAVGARFQSVSRAYEAYKTKNGARLDGEWNDLVTFVQYHLTTENLDEAMRRIESFHAKLRE